MTGSKDSKEVIGILYVYRSQSVVFCVGFIFWQLQAYIVHVIHS